MAVILPVIFVEAETDEQPVSAAPSQLAMDAAGVTVSFILRPVNLTPSETNYFSLSIIGDRFAVVYHCFPPPNQCIMSLSEGHLQAS